MCNTPPFEIWQRYILFAGDGFYPEGGWNDWRGNYEKLEDLKEDLEKLNETWHFDWWHIVDMTTWDVIADQNDWSGSLD